MYVNYIAPTAYLAITASHQETSTKTPAAVVVSHAALLVPASYHSRVMLKKSATSVSPSLRTGMIFCLASISGVTIAFA